VETRTAGDPAAPAQTTNAPHDLDRVVEILAGAFYHDPLWAWAFHDDDLRAGQHGRFWRLFIEGASRFPGVWLDASRSATAVWIPPGESELSPAQEEQFRPMLEELLDPAGVGRVLSASAALDAAHPVDVPHHYLTLLGTDPASTAQGLGLGLLRDTLTVVDADGLPAYLEASNAANVPLYERYGFRVRSVIEIGGDCPDVYGMWRDPVVASSSPKG